MLTDLTKESTTQVPNAAQAVVNLSLRSPLDPLTLVATAMRIFETFKGEPIAAKVLNFMFEDLHKRFVECLELRSFALQSPNVYAGQASENLCHEGRDIAALARWISAFIPMVRLNVHTSLLEELKLYR